MQNYNNILKQNILGYQALLHHLLQPFNYPETLKLLKMNAAIEYTHTHTQRNVCGSRVERGRWMGGSKKSRGSS